MLLTTLKSCEICTRIRGYKKPGLGRYLKGKGILNLRYDSLLESRPSVRS